jgi:hypothetical protein
MMLALRLRLPGLHAGEGWSSAALNLQSLYARCCSDHSAGRA